LGEGEEGGEEKKKNAEINRILEKSKTKNHKTKESDGVKICARKETRPQYIISVQAEKQPSVKETKKSPIAFPADRRTNDKTTATSALDGAKSCTLTGNL